MGLWTIYITKTGEWLIMKKNSKELPFNFCPNCGSQNITFDRPQKMKCNDCDFIYYQNNAAAVAVILKKENKILLVKRAKEPQKGLYDLPGGFVDPEESNEDAVYREIKEELNITLDSIKYIASEPNKYPYKGTLYHTCDSFFIANIKNTKIEIEKNEISEWKLIDRESYNPEKIAFNSIKTVLNRYFKK